MLSFVLKKIGRSFLILISISALLFLCTTLNKEKIIQNTITTSFPATLNVDQKVQAYKEINERLNVDVSYFGWIKNIATGNWGYSFSYKKQVYELITHSMGWTLLIGFGAGLK